MSAAIEWSAAAPRDVLHWTGIVAFAIALAHGLAIFAIRPDW